ISSLRIETPVRFSACTHRQCFDVDSWSSLIELMEIIKCPVCSRAYASSKGLINDWYGSDFIIQRLSSYLVDRTFDAILRQTPDLVQEVMIETNGEWHTRDNKYCSSGWKTSTHQNASQAQNAGDNGSSVVIDSDESAAEVAPSSVKNKPDRSVISVDDDEKPEQRLNNTRCVNQ
ncbi:SUMO ligase siz1, partial [Ceratobasidium sp. 392]